jgi:hypothetical protein
MAVAMLAGTSAFAEDRPANETRPERTRIERNRDTSSSSRSQAQAQRNNGSEWRRQQQSQQQPQTYRNNTNNSSERRNDSRNDRRYDNNNRNDSNRNYNRNDSRNDNRNGSRYDNRNDNRNNNRYDNRNGSRNDNRYDNRNDRNRSYGRYDNNRSYGNRGYDRYDRSRPHYYSGRVSRYERYGAGYRVWIGGAPFPFFIPEVRFRSFPFRVGVSIRLGGYYNPLGYYDYYDAGPVAGAYTSGDLRGVVESVDYRNGTFVIHDDLSGDFVTAVMRTRDRLMDDLRPGDYVELSGAWTRGVFEAYRVAGIDTGAYRR